MAKTVKERHGLECPDCGRDDGLKVSMRTWATLLPDGTDETGELAWTTDSDIICVCSWSGKAYEAAVSEPETDPENIHDLPGIRQSIEEDRK